MRVSASLSASECCANVQLLAEGVALLERSVSPCGLMQCASLQTVLPDTKLRAELLAKGGAMCTCAECVLMAKDGVCRVGLLVG
jgi:hypothetical protein